MMLDETLSPLSKIQAIADMFTPDATEDKTISNNSCYGIFCVLHESVEEIKKIIDQALDEQVAEAKAYRESRAALDKKIAEIRTGNPDLARYIEQEA